MSSRPKNLARTDPDEPEPKRRARGSSFVDGDLERYIADVVTADLDLDDPDLAWIRDQRDGEAEPHSTRLIPETDDLTLDAGQPVPPPAYDPELLDFPETASLAEGGGLWAGTADLRPIVERRRHERYEFDNIVVRALLKDSEGNVGRGRIRDLSCGGMFVETGTSFPFKSDVFVEVKLANGRSITLAGRVVYQPSMGMAIRVKTDVQTRAFLLAFIDEIIEPSCEESRRELKITQRAVPQGGESSGLDMAALSQAWNRVLRHQEKDEIHQAFIQKCLKARRLDFALEKYRQLQSERPDDDRVTQYLTQVGTILNFQAFSRDDKDGSPAVKVPWPMKLLFAFFGGLFLLWLLLMFKK